LSRGPVSAKTGDAVINLRSSLLVLALAVGGCQKAPDVDKIQSQALMTVKSYAGGLEVLQRRADALLAQYRAMQPNLPGAPEASRRLGEARSEIEELRTFISGVPGAFAAAAKGTNEDLQKSIDATDDKLIEGWRTIVADLTAFENWAAFAGPTVAMAQPAPTPAAPPTATAPATPPTPEHIGEHPPGTPTPTPTPAAPTPTR
jgi:hypothetical protein